MVVQVEDGLTFVTLFRKILAGAQQLSRSTLDEVFVGHLKESMSTPFLCVLFVLENFCMFVNKFFTGNNE